MSRFASAQGSNVDAINTVADVANQASQFSDHAFTAGTSTLTVDQTVNSVLRASGQTAAVSLTTPTAEAIVAALKNAQVGSAFELVIINNNTSSGAITVVAGDDVTLVGTTAVAITKAMFYKGVVTNASAGSEAVSLVGLLAAAV